MLQSTDLNDLLIRAALKRQLPITQDTSLDFPIRNRASQQWKVKKADYFTQTTSVPGVQVDFEDLHEFRNRVSNLGSEIVAVLAEDGEHGERHITTFVLKDSETLVTQIVDIQADIVEKYVKKSYSFHIRVAPRDKDRKVLLPGGPYYLLTWRA